MTKDERIASYKYSVLQHAQENKNITSTCRFFNLSIITYNPSLVNKGNFLISSKIVSLLRVLKYFSYF